MCYQHQYFPQSFCASQVLPHHRIFGPWPRSTRRPRCAPLTLCHFKFAKTTSWPLDRRASANLLSLVAPTTLGPDDHQGLRLEHPQQRLALVPAEIQLNRSLDRSLGAPVREIEKALLGVIDSDRRSGKREYQGHHLRGDKVDPRPEIAGQAPRHFEGGQSALGVGEDDIDLDSEARAGFATSLSCSVLPNTCERAVDLDAHGPSPLM